MENLSPDELEMLHLAMHRQMIAEPSQEAQVLHDKVRRAINTLAFNRPSS